LGWSKDHSLFSEDYFNNRKKGMIEMNGTKSIPITKEMVWEPYWKVKANRAGLSISKEFIDGQGGCIKVNSAPGKGSVFSFFLPMVKT